MEKAPWHELTQADAKQVQERALAALLEDNGRLDHVNLTIRTSSATTRQAVTKQVDGIPFGYGSLSGFLVAHEDGVRIAVPIHYPKRHRGMNRELTVDNFLVNMTDDGNDVRSTVDQIKRNIEQLLPYGHPLQRAV